MGRWAQQQRRGGGGGAGSLSCIAAIDCLTDEGVPSVVIITYASDVDATAFDFTDFSSSGGAAGTSVVQADPNQLQISFDAQVTAGQMILYNNTSGSPACSGAIEAHA